EEAAPARKEAAPEKKAAASEPKDAAPRRQVAEPVGATKAAAPAPAPRAEPTPRPEPSPRPEPPRRAEPPPPAQGPRDGDGRRPAAPDDDAEREPLSQLRRTTAARLAEAQRPAAILPPFNEADPGALLPLRSRARHRSQA